MNTKDHTSLSNIGKVLSVRGSVVDVVFNKRLPQQDRAKAKHLKS